MLKITLSSRKRPNSIQTGYLTIQSKKKKKKNYFFMICRRMLKFFGCVIERNIALKKKMFKKKMKGKTITRGLLLKLKPQVVTRQWEREFACGTVQNKSRSSRSDLEIE